MAINLFLSYTWSKDTFNDIMNFHKELEANLKKKTEDNDLSIFYDKNNITSEGEESYFKPILKKHLENSKILIVLLSEAWLKSKWCTWEYENFTKNSETLIIPILWQQYDKENIIPISVSVKEEIENLSNLTFLNKTNIDILSQDVANMVTNFLNKNSQP